MAKTREQLLARFILKALRSPDTMWHIPHHKKWRGECTELSIPPELLGCGCTVKLGYQPSLVPYSVDGEQVPKPFPKTRVYRNGKYAGTARHVCGCIVAVRESERVWKATCIRPTS